MPHISYAGVPLLLEDPGYEFQVWLEQTLSLRDLTLFGVEPWDIYQDRNIPRGPFLGGTFDVADCSPSSCGTVTIPSVPFVGLPLPNYSTRRPPRWKINTLWWPTGATRWAIGLFLTDAASLARILRVVKQNNGWANLVVREFRNGVASTTHTFTRMYLLPPRELNNTETGVNGFLLCLVDQRYFWQFLDTGLLEVGESTEWSEVYDDIATAMNVPIVYDVIHGGYLRPDPEELTRRYENAGLLLDAVAHSVGQRIVLTVGNVVRAMNAASSTAINAANQVLVLNSGLSSGGTHAPYRGTLYPAAVMTVFPAQVDGEFLVDGNVYPRTVGIATVAAAAANTYGFVPGTVKVIHTTCAAQFSTGDTLSSIGDGSAMPLNEPHVNALSVQIATDYYAWLAQQYDESGVGFVPWNPSGFDDYVWWHLGYQQRLPYGEGHSESGRAT